MSQKERFLLNIFCFTHRHEMYETACHRHLSNIGCSGK
jgi:hypothetical protein